MDVNRQRRARFGGQFQYTSAGGVAAAALALMLAGCGGDSSSGGGDGAGGANPVGLAPIPAERVFDPDGALEATIRRTDNGVPHIAAENLESAGFGQGYAQARDNICLIAEQVIKARSERALFFGPGVPGAMAPPASIINIIKDFSYKALGVYSGAEETYPSLSGATRALLEGFAAGYNKYLADAGGAIGLTDPRCMGQPWVRAITAVDLYAYYSIIALYASGDQFTTGVLFFAAPPGVSPAPRPVMTTSMSQPQRTAALQLASNFNAQAMPPLDIQEAMEMVPFGLGSNGWGIGSELTENGRGALLANPHFPFYGPRRFWQSHMTVPGVYNVNGGTLVGVPLPLIGFNENLGWTHTVSTSNRFTAYVLVLTQGNLGYLKNGQIRPIEKRTFQIQVSVGGPQPLTFEKDFYYSEYGPMIKADLINMAFPAWGEPSGPVTVAFTYRDANAVATDIVDQWLGMGRADNLEEFQTVFQNARGTLWVNTMYADDQGNAFYIDASSVPNLSDAAIAAYRQTLATDPALAAAYAQGLVVLGPVLTSLYDWQPSSRGFLTPYTKMPKLVRSDYVQNSNNSYWATNPAAFLTGFSPLYGPVETPQGLRTRFGLFMLENPTDGGPAGVPSAGVDGLFSATDLMEMLYSNRAFHTEGVTGVLDALLARCTDIGAGMVNADAGARAVAQGCAVLAGWDRLFNLDSVGAHVFRVFIDHYNDLLPGDYAVAFDPADPINTPAQPAPAPADLADDPLLIALANGLDKLDAAPGPGGATGIPYAAPLGAVQFVLLSSNAPPLQFLALAPTRPPIPWPGGDGETAGVFNDNSFSGGPLYPLPLATDTLFPLAQPSAPADPPIVPNTGGLSNTPTIPGWQRTAGTSWHFGLQFTDDGPEAVGLLSYSQSSNSTSPFFSDQHPLFSAGDYRTLYFDEAEIAANTVTTTTVTGASID